MANKTHRITIADMVVWAKDRFVDDFHSYMDDFQNGPEQQIGKPTNYASRTNKERLRFHREVARMSGLLCLPNNSADSLKKLRKAGYWNGKNDTFWECGLEPFLGYEGQ